MIQNPLTGELSRRRLGTTSGALRREARAISRAGGNPQRFLEEASKAKLQEGGAISSAEENRAMQEFNVRAQAETARQQAGVAREMAGGGTLRSMASGTNTPASGTNTPASGTNAPARMTPSQPLGAMQSVPAPPANQARADIEQFGLDEAIKRYYQRSAEADKTRAQRAKAIAAAGPMDRGIPAPSTPSQGVPDRPEVDAALAESAATRQRVAARRAGTLADLDTVPDMMNQAVRRANTSSPTVSPTAPTASSGNSKSTATEAQDPGVLRSDLDWVKQGLPPENVRKSLLAAGYKAENVETIMARRGVTQEAFESARASTQSQNQKAAARLEESRNKAWRDRVRTNPPRLASGALQGTIAGDVWNSLVDPGGVMRAEMKRQEREKLRN